jgi:uncharacterized membrane protein YeaQ/YmgE (transglycosylase-associated protein family)
MDILLVIIAMVVVGLIMGAVAGLIWKDNRPYGVRADYIASILTTVIVGLFDWYLIPLLGFSDTIKIVGIIFEPPLSALLVLWIMRKTKQ